MKSRKKRKEVQEAIKSFYKVISKEDRRRKVFSET